MLSSIRARVVLACVALVVFSVLTSTATDYSIARSSMEASIAHELTSSSNDHAAEIGEWIAGKTQMIASLQDVVLTNDPLPMLQQIAVAGGFFDVGVGYPDKTAKFNDWPHPPSSYDPTARPWYQAAAQSGKPVAIPYVSTSGALLVGLGIPVIRDGVVKAVLDGNIALDSVVGNVKSIHPTPSSFGMLVDRSGRIIAHPDPKLRLKPVTDVAADFMSVITGSAGPGTAPMKIVVDGRTKLVRAQSVPGTDWDVIVALDESEATAGMRSLLSASVVALLVIVGVASVIGTAITATAFRRLGNVCQAMAKIGAGTGDLTQRLRDEGRDEVANIARSFNQFVAKLQGVMLEIRGASESVGAAANEIASASRDLSTRTESAAASLQQTAASMDQISGTVDQSAAAATEADERSNLATQIASRGGEIVSDAVGTMSEIEHASSQIGTIIRVIDGIAFQTNILALNAAVEAARAGEQGRGFAVVAHEVRTLAQRSAQAAREVKQLVEATVSRVAAGSSQVRRAGETMSEIVSNSQNVQSIISSIARASTEQTRGVQEVNHAVMQLDAMVQQNAALVEETAAASTALQTQANALASAIGRFKID
ncbi:methyl-accepting chemotaxis protein [Burkholderia glumae]|uniref:HAMP domain-containing protein n=1 Tax=Burkholderia glumae TaxID=337 RepID=A0AAP9Y1M5_BURGL|nr:methyl-accepting chemotaxis protein [Burkholderia glumae]ACR31345.1 Methyl-accepting chemotaxis sensory transducer [Burkholderia glumae BGR1]KHJ63326.1 chemotaxis protein [Burkholderia glumae]MCM2485501.1 methyl-accepting chemotaxis protein [Burkholderia glumae]MCM2495908.1 methyl-accepting chemotaxis protein [Burkholderia glumae]MCM2511195.1 methyl-accepting chemotaxis protein [Burkholderia glumae]